MNFINKILMRLVLLPEALYKKMGVDTRHLSLILGTKLMMDDRRPNTFHQTRIRKPGSVSYATLGTMLFSALLGLFFLTSFMLSGLIIQMTIFFSLFIFMLAITLISDFTSVLIDVRDNIIILSKPVTDKTFVLSRLMHIFIHVTKVTLPMGLPSLVYVCIYKSVWAAVVLFFLIVSATVLTIFFINVIYLIILKFSSPQKFQNIISYVQIGMTICIYAGFQLVPRLAGKMSLEDYHIFDRAWIWLLPSYWYAMGFEFFYSVRLQTLHICGALITILAPVVTLWIVIKYFAPSFNQKLSLISASSVENKTGKTASGKKSGAGFWSYLANRLASIFTKRGEERMGFLLTWNLTSRERDFKLKTYPSMGYMVVIAVSMLLSARISFSDLQGQTGNSRATIVSMLYASSLLLVVAISQLQYSDKFKASWFYFTTPVSRPGLILTGCLKAAIVKFFMPWCLIIAIVGLLAIGVKLLPNLLLAFSNVSLGCIILSLITLRSLPFSAPQNAAQKTGAQVRSFVSTMVIIFMGLLHYLIYSFTWVVIISCCLSLLANWLVIDYLKNKTWKQVLAQYNEE